MEVKIPNQSK